METILQGLIQSLFLLFNGNPELYRIIARSLLKSPVERMVKCEPGLFFNMSAKNESIADKSYRPAVLPE